MNSSDSGNGAPPSQRDLREARRIRAALARSGVYKLERLAYTDAANIPPRPRFINRWKGRFAVLAKWWRGGN